MNLYCRGVGVVGKGHFTLFQCNELGIQCSGTSKRFVKGLYSEEGIEGNDLQASRHRTHYCRTIGVLFYINIAYN